VAPADVVKTLAADADAILRALDASVADISDPQPAT
jgi:hypothetical protein